MNKLLLILSSLTIILTSCRSADKQEAAVGSREHTEVPGVSSRPDTIESEIAIEGMTEEMDMYLLESPEDFPLDFSTYIPVDMQSGTMRTDKGNAICIWAAFGGITNRAAYLTISAFPASAGAEEARETAVRKMEKLGDVAEDTLRYPWAEAVYSLEGDRTGFLALAREKNRWFYLLAAYPPEYTDGMGPRIHLIMEKWRWKDDGESLSE